MRFSKSIDFSKRVSPSELPEVMDGDCTYEEFRACLSSLRRVNRWFLGYRPTLAWLDKLPRPAGQPIHIADVGCGGGDLLREIAAWSQKRGVPVKLTGIDLNPYSIRAAMEWTSAGTNIAWITGDAMALPQETQVDVIVSSLMTHHLEDEQIIAFLHWMRSTAKLGWFINDLERSEWGYRMFPLLPWHPMVRHDGPVSFRRAFKVDDWRRLLAEAGVPEQTVRLEKWWPGRLCVGGWSSGVDVSGSAVGELKNASNRSAESLVHPCKV